jgi:hypothetical protein
MRTAPLLRVASVVSLLFAAGHTMGARKDWSPIGESDVLRAMRTFRFDAMGVSRTYLDFYLGLAFTVSVFLLLQSVLLWQMATLAKTEPRQVRPMIGSLAIAALACALLAWRFIFPVPAVFSLVLAFCLSLAFFFPS